MKKMLDINTDALAKFANQLEKLSKSALPVAVRQTLNSTAYDVKKRTMLAIVDKTFEKRQPNFFKANSKVEPAQGFNISNMRSIVGFVEGGLKGTQNYAVKDLEQQEHGGTIGGRSFIPLKDARANKDWKKKVRAANSIESINSKLYNSKDAKGKNDAVKYVKTAAIAGKHGWVIGNKKNSDGNRIVYQIRSFKRLGKGHVVNSVAMYALKTNRKIKPKATHFMQKACEQSAAQMEQFFIKHATKQLAKYK